MSAATVRMLIADPYEYDRATATGDGATVEFKLPNAPLKSGSVTVYFDGIAQGAATYSVDLDLGLVTFVAAPGAAVAIVITYQHSILSATAIADMLTLESNNDKRAAAQCLETIASSESLIQKKVRVLDWTTDGPAVAADLRQHAAELRKQADEDELAALGGFEVAEMVYDAFSEREKVRKEALREG